MVQKYFDTIGFFYLFGKDIEIIENLREEQNVFMQK